MLVEQYDFLSDKITLFYSEKGLKFISLADDPIAEYTAWFGPSNFEFADQKRYAEVVSAYLQHRDLPAILVDWEGTTLQKQVWQYLQTIPQGKTINYSELANAVGAAQAVRAVASAVGKNPLLVLVGCHRIVRKDGSIGEYRAGKDWKTKLIDFERKVG